MKLTWSQSRLKVLSTLAIVVVIFNSIAAPVAVSAATGITPQNLFELHNAQRRSAGLPTLKLNNTLAVSAQRKAQAMLDSNCWSHYCPSGKEPWDFFKDAGYVYSVAGENLAEGFFNVDDVMQAWMNSPTHKSNILRGEYEEVGFGIVQGKFQGRNNNIIIAVHFATPYTPTENPGNGGLSQLPVPQILTPQEGQAFNTTQITVSGSAPQASEVRLFSNGEVLTTMDAHEGLFTRNFEFSQGEYTLSAQSRVGERSASSAPVKFNVDTTSDPIDSSNIVFSNISPTQSIMLLNQQNLRFVQMNIAGAVYTFTTSDINTWQAVIDPQLILQGGTIVATTTDKAGNTWEGRLEATNLSGNLLNAQIKAVPLPGEGEGRVISAELKLQGNVFFIGTMFVFFLADYLRLRDTGLTKQRGRTHLHIAIIIIAIIILLAGTFSANILNGVKLF